MKILIYIAFVLFGANVSFCQNFINDKETKRVLKLVNKKRTNTSRGNYEEVESTVSYYDTDTKSGFLDEISEKVGLTFTECDNTNTVCIFKKEYTYGIYNVKTKQSSMVFDEVELLEPFGLFKVKKDVSRKEEIKSKEKKK